MLFTSQASSLGDFLRLSAVKRPIAWSPLYTVSSPLQVNTTNRELPLCPIHGFRLCYGISLLLSFHPPRTLAGALQLHRKWLSAFRPIQQVGFPPCGSFSLLLPTSFALCSPSLGLPCCGHPTHSPPIELSLSVRQSKQSSPNPPNHRRLPHPSFFFLSICISDCTSPHAFPPPSLFSPRCPLNNQTLLLLQAHQQTQAPQTMPRDSSPSPPPLPPVPPNSPVQR